EDDLAAAMARGSTLMATGPISDRITLGSVRGEDGDDPWQYESRPDHVSHELPSNVLRDVGRGGRRQAPDRQRRQGQSGQSGLPLRAWPQHQRDLWQSATIAVPPDPR